MKTTFFSFCYTEPVPRTFLRDRKLAKYGGFDAMASIHAAGALLAEHPVAPDIPVYFAHCLSKVENIGLAKMANASRGEDGKFSNALYLNKGFLEAEPLFQLKILQNTTLALVSINFGLTGEHGVAHTESGALLLHALGCGKSCELLLGSCAADDSGTIRAGFALVERDALADSVWLGSSKSAVEMLQSWHEGGPL